MGGQCYEWSRLDLGRIGGALAGLGSSDADGVLSVSLAEEPISDDALRRLLEGYRRVDRLLADRIDLFSYGAAGQLLELNHIVLCGVTPERRAQFGDHIAETARVFYERPGIGDLTDWYKRNRGRAPRNVAAGLFLRLVSTPQLFVEGNSRTACLLASYHLARCGLPPLVIGVESFARYAEVLRRTEAVDRTSFSSLFTAEFVASRLAGLIEATGDPSFLLDAAPTGAVGSGGSG